MSKFDELKQALAAKNSDSYSKNVEAARKLVNAALRTFKDEPGEQIRGKVQVNEQMVSTNRRAAVRILVDAHPVFALWYAEDGDVAIDLHPSDTNSEPITLKVEDREEFTDKIDELIEIAKEENAKKPCPLDNLIERLTNDHPELKKAVESLQGKNKATEEQENTYLHKLVKVVNAIKGLEGPKYNNLHAIWRDGVTMLTDGNDRIMVITKYPFGGIGITDDVNGGPQTMVTVSGKVGELAESVVKLVQENLENDFDKTSDLFDKLNELFDALPSRVRTNLLEDMLKDLSKRSM